MSEKYKLEVDIELLKKYNRPGPRYTSYPTAPHFHSSFQGEEFKKEIMASNQPSETSPLSLYFHLPFCKTLCYYCGCNMMITHNPEKIDDYLDWLKKEIRLVHPLINKNRKVGQLHWGGGSPDYLSPGQIESLFTTIQERFTFDEEAEIGIEIDPRRLTPEHLPLIRKLGFNRISFGVQDFNPEVQKAVNRIQPEEMTRGVIQESRDLGFDSINIDLIYGLPYQTLETYQNTLSKVLEISPDRLAVFNYAHVPWMKKHQESIKEEALPSAEERLNMLKNIIETLTGAGYIYIGMDHFAKENDPLSQALLNHSLYRNFQGYTTWREAEIYAFGISSISQLRGCYAQNTKTIPPYKKFIEEGKIPTVVGCALSEDDKLRRYVITELMCNSQIRVDQVKEKYAVDFHQYFADALSQLEPFVKDNLLEISGEGIQVREEGRLVIRNIAMPFDAYLGKVQKENMYSKTI